MKNGFKKKTCIIIRDYNECLKNKTRMNRILVFDKILVNMFFFSKYKKNRL